MSNERWSSELLPDLSGKTVVVTGANSGLGYHTARGLAARGAHVVVACRDREKGQAALEAIAADHRHASVELVPLDLADLASVQACAEALCARRSTIDVLCNNAGVMALPYRRTKDGFEMQFGTNHLGHFALTGLLLERILAAPAGRVVTITSGAHLFGRMRFRDLQWERFYSKWGAYGMSKLANLLFTYELQSRLERAGRRAIAVAAHPGYAATNLQYGGPRMQASVLMERGMAFFNRWVAQDAETGALPQLYACAAPDVAGGDFIGPDGFMGLWGHPRRVKPGRHARDAEAMQQLWSISEQLTGVRYEALEGSAAA